MIYDKNPYEEESEEIVKRIRSSKEAQEVESIEKKSKKGIFLTLIGMVTVGIAGYVGFKAFQSSNVTEQTQNSVPTMVAKVENNNTLVNNLKEEVIKQKASKVESSDVSAELQATPVKALEEQETVAVSKEIVEAKATEKKVKSRVITVQSGDTLASIAEKYYGNPMDFKRIIRANRDIRSDNTQLHPGQKIIIPQMENSRQQRMFTVRKGDSLASISQRFYGTTDKIQKIIDANYNIKTENSTLQIGQRIYIPR